MTGANRIALCAVALAALTTAAAAADVRAKADVACKPTPTPLAYDCAIRLTDAKTGAPLTGVEVMVGADMPSMPMAHNVKPAKVAPGAEAGAYSARLVLEMHGDWAVKIDLSGPVRDRIVKSMRFEPKQ